MLVRNICMWFLRIREATMAMQVWTAEEFKRGIRALGLTQAQTAQLLGVAPRTVSDWAAQGVSGPAVVALKMAAELPYLVRGRFWNDAGL